MMKQLFFIIIAAMASGSIQAQSESARTLTGLLSFQMLQEHPDFDWFREGATAYIPDNAVIRDLTLELHEVDLIVFLGTWCDDSHRLIPQLYKVLCATGFPMDRVTIYGLDMTKTSADGLHKTYDIEWLPTIIVKQHEKEIGRITEVVTKSVEADLNTILIK